MPDITKKITTDINYFTISEEEFTFTDTELSMIEKNINESGQQMLSSELYFVKPIIKHYVLNIVLSICNIRLFLLYNIQIIIFIKHSTV